LLRPVSRTEPRKRVELVLDRGEYTTALLTFGLWVACFLLRAFRSLRKKALIFFYSFANICSFI